VANARAILCRSGYSSVMDLIPLKKQCFMVATPGQTEQEYLSGFLASQGRITAIDQNKLQVSELLAAIQ
jgi:predicted glycosyltransferase